MKIFYPKMSTLKRRELPPPFWKLTAYPLAYIEIISWGRGTRHSQGWTDFFEGAPTAHPPIPSRSRSPISNEGEPGGKDFRGGNPHPPRITPLCLPSFTPLQNSVNVRVQFQPASSEVKAGSPAGSLFFFTIRISTDQSTYVSQKAKI